MLIECSEFNFKLLIPLIFPIFKRIQDYTKKSYLIDDNQLFKTFRYFVSYIFAIIPFLIIKYRIKNLQNKKILIKLETTDTKSFTSLTTGSFSNEIHELKKKNERKRKIYSFLFLSVLCILGIFCYFYRFLFELTEFANAKQSIGIFFEIADYTILSYIILKQKLYKHNFVSAGIIAFVLIIIFIISIPYIEANIFLSIVYYFFFSLCFGAYDILGKKYMINFFITPYFLMFIIGLLNSILILIYELFAYFINKDVSGITIGFQKNILDVGDVFLFILDLLVECIWNLGIWLTVYYLTPCHYFISEYISEYSYYIINAINGKEEFYRTANIIIISIGYFINFFCCLIFNEVIIINFFGLERNTKKKISQRQNSESLDISNTKTMIELEEPYLDDNLETD